jgi:hypothetical protein
LKLIEFVDLAVCVCVCVCVNQYSTQQIQDQNSYELTKKLCIEVNNSLSVVVTPSFLASLDDFLPLVQPKFTTVDDVLDELHVQFSSRFNEAASTSVMVRESQFSVKVANMKLKIVQAIQSYDRLLVSCVW